MKHKQNGFTIVEVAVVILVIAILASVTILSYGAIRDRARDTTITTEMVRISQQLAAYNLANNNKYPSSLSQIDVKAPDNMTLTYTQQADQRGYQLIATMGTRSFSLSHQDNSPNRCDNICIPTN